jgi:hypothetical protein
MLPVAVPLSRRTSRVCQSVAGQIQTAKGAGQYRKLAGWLFDFARGAILRLRQPRLFGKALSFFIAKPNSGNSSNSGNFVLVFAVALVALIVILSGRALADQFVWGAGPVGGYFDPGAWTDLDPLSGNNGSYPGELGQDQLAVNNGATVTLDLSDSRVPGLFLLNNVNLGGGDFGAGAPSVEGYFVIDGSAVTNGVFDRGRFYIGDALGSAQSAVGTLSTTAAGISALDHFYVGRNQSTDTTSSAHGTATIDGALTAGGAVFVGTTYGPTGTAYGEVTAKSLDASQLIVGNAGPKTLGDNAAGTATGRVTITAGDAVVSSNLSVGKAFGPDAVADGGVEVTNGNLVFESGSTTFGPNISIGTTSSFFDTGARSATGQVEALAMRTLRDPGEVGIALFSVGIALDEGHVGTGSLLAPGRTGNVIELDANLSNVVQIGVARSGGMADGTVAIGDALSVVVANQLDQRELQVGVITGGDPGQVSTATGAATLGGIHNFRRFDVGVVTAGEGTATGTLALGEDGYQGLFLNSGLNRIGATSGAGDGVGELTVTGGDVLTGGGFGGFGVGYAVGGSGQADIGDATGTMRILGGALRPRGDIDPTFGIPQLLMVGRAELEGTQTSAAMGTFELDASSGPRQAMTVSSLVVGSSSTQDSSVADVTGTATVRNSDVTAFSISVGQSTGHSASTARVDGSLTFENSAVAVVRQSETASAFVNVGSAFGSTSVDTLANGRLVLRDSTMAVDGSMSVATGFLSHSLGTVDLDGSLLTVSEDLQLGTGSEVLFRLDGLDRGTGYGAIDVGGTARLGGTALIDFGDGFDFSAAKLTVFDLIVADSFSYLAVATMFDSVLFDGLLPGFVANALYVNEGGQDIFRVTVNDTPLPPTLVLLLSGVAGFVVVGRRGRRRAAA